MNMNPTRTIITVLMTTLATGLLGCSWSDQFAWPWQKQSAPVTEAAWSSQKPWPEPETRPAEHVAAAPTTRPVDPTPVTVQNEPLVIGETREITTSVIEVKGKFITVQEILLDAKDQLSEIENDARFVQNVATVINETIYRRINSELIYAEADARLSKPQKAHVQSQIDDIRRNMIANAGGSEVKLKKMLAENNLTLEESLEKTRRRLTVQLYQQIKFIPAISITRQMLLGYYNKHKSDFSVDRKVAMQLIAVMTEDYLPKGIGHNPTKQEIAKARSAAKEKIDQADKLLKSGKDFTEVAKKFTSIKRESGGKLPLWPEGSLKQKKVEKAGFALKQGQRSEIVESPLARDDLGRILGYGGFYIVKAYQVQEGKTTSFEDAQPKINEILRTRQFNRLAAEASKKLNTSKIPLSREFQETAMEEAIRIYGKKPRR